MSEQVFPWEVSAEETKQLLDAGKIVLVDVRQPEEYAVSKINGSVLIPLMDLPSRLPELDPDQPMVIFCKMGSRSAQAVHFLRQQGFPLVANMAGGIYAWSERVDPTVPRY